MGTCKSQALFKRAQAITPGGVHSPVRAFQSVHADPFVVERGEGPYLFDVDGNRYIDYVCSWGPLVLGHGHPAVVEALCKQAERGTSYGACSDKELELAELIISLMPNIEMLRFVNSGTEATMSALRLARGFTGRNKIVKFVGCYHGHCDHLLVKAGSGVLTLGIPGTPGVPPNITADTLTTQYNDLNDLGCLFDECPNDIAAVILEPVVGNCGLIKPEPGFLEGVRALCTQHGALLIFDEVMTGFRVDRQGAQGLYGIVPDLTCLGKVIGGGLPVGAYGGKRDIMAQIAPQGPVYQAGTLSGNPLAMVAGLTTLKEWCKESVFNETAGLTKTLTQAFQELSHAYSIPLCADAVGTMFGFSFQPGPVRDFETANKADLNQFEKFFKLCLEQGVFFAPSQFEAGFLSYAHKDQALPHTLEVLKEVFSKLSS
ncbi:glutamate-1-semialdehyde 2,1-aminomutase [Oligoflexia bacterium]|nr:glutamate-1-semialdehyde 2,1-aminomutase [Oligoflexia bacterium]